LTDSVTTGPGALGWDDLAPLRPLLTDADLRVRAAAAEAAARLPLTASAWGRVGRMLSELLDTEDPSIPCQRVARAAAHAPLLSLRRQLRMLAQDGSHPAHHAASVALAEVGDDSVLATEVSRLLARPVNDYTALRLAGLPLEHLAMSPERIPDLPASEGSRSFYTAVAAARLGDTRRLDEWLDRLRDVEGWLPPAALSVPGLRAVLPLPDDLLGRLDGQLSDGSKIHDMLRVAWLTPIPAPPTSAVSEAAASLTTPGRSDVLASPPHWPRPVDFIDTAATAGPSTDPWAEEVPSFGVGFEPEGIEVPSSAAPPASPGAAPPMRGLDPKPPAVETSRPPAYARLSCPSAVVVEEEFDLELGLAERPTRGVTAQPLNLPDRPTYALTVQVIVDGFALRQGEPPTFDLDVTPQAPYPTRIVHLTAVADPDLGPVRSILAVFSVDGRTVGSATRAVEVVASQAQLPRGAADAPPTGVDTSLPADVQTADLTITISRGDDIDGRRLMWSFQSPHPSVSGSTKAGSCTLGSRPEEFAKSLMKTAGKVQGELLKAEIAGAGRVIARLVPAQVHDAIRTTATAVGGAPSVLLLSADPYVPWELARIDPPWLPEAPPLLGAQAAVGRWALREPGPTSEAPRSVSVQEITIVRGIYERVIGFNRLKHAEQEALDLEAAYGATLVDAAEGPFFACLRGEPSAQILHFAMHGKFDPMGLQDGLILVDGNVIDPLMILGADLAQHPFVFLNACQVGQAGETLGQYGGMAQSFVEAGASAVIAPLWVVKDDVARDVSLRFYESAFKGTSPAEFLRTERARDGSGTHLAYVLYGHPLLQLTRSKEADGDGDPAGP
jgi:CHAT domain